MSRDLCGILKGALTEKRLRNTFLRYGNYRLHRKADTLWLRTPGPNKLKRSWSGDNRACKSLSASTSPRTGSRYSAPAYCVSTNQKQDIRGGFLSTHQSLPHIFTNLTSRIHQSPLTSPHIYTHPTPQIQPQFQKKVGALCKIYRIQWFANLVYTRVLFTIEDGKHVRCLHWENWPF